MDQEHAQQKFYLLDRLHKRKDRALTRKALKATKSLEKILGDDAAVDALLTELVAAGHLAETHGRNKSVTYHLTEAGRTHLQTLPQAPAPTKAPRAPRTRSDKAPKIRDAPRGGWDSVKPFLLLQLLAADGSLLGGTANRFGADAKKHLDLNPARAAHARSLLADEGYVEITKQGRAVVYKLSDAGRARVATLEQNPVVEVRLPGRILNELLAAARRAGGSPVQPTIAATAAPEPPAAEHVEARRDPYPPADLPQAAYDAFQELRRERFSHTGLVPIHAVRRLIAERFAAAAARHDALDEPILQLWREKRVNLIPISDLRDGTPEQLADSIVDDYQTLFYLEERHDRRGNP